MPQFLLVDDHAVLRRGLRQLLAEEFKGAIFEEAQDAERALALVTKTRWDLIILDVTLPGRSGLELLKDFKALAPKVPVLILSMHPEEQFAIRSLRAGAVGYLNKDAPPADLLRAVHKVLSGGRFVSPKLAERLALGIASKTDLPHEALSDREFEVMRQIAMGKRIKEIGVSLNLSVKTVSTYRSRVLEKMEFQSNADLTQYALKHGLLEDAL